MARVTIIPIDQTVYVGDVWIQGIDMTGVPENIHAIQWNWNDSGVGELEYNDGTQNESISEFPDWAVTCVERFDTKLEEIRVQEAAAEAARLAEIAAAEEEARLAAEAQALVEAALRAAATGETSTP